MSKGIGILLDKTANIMVSNGSMVIGNTTLQNQYLILLAQKGEFKNYPTLGVGISNIIGDDDVLEWKKQIRDEFQKDDLNVKKIDLNLQTGDLKIDAEYK